MNIDRKRHWQFLEDELRAETEEFNKKFFTTALSLLQNTEEMFVAQFVTFKSGEMIMKFPNTRALPRKGEFLECMVLPPELQNYRNWNDLTYRELYKRRYYSTESVCIWHSPAEDKRFSLVGFSKISLEFAEYIKDSAGIILVFAPQRPPIDYVMNLQRIVENTEKRIREQQQQEQQRQYELQQQQMQINAELAREAKEMEYKMHTEKLQTQILVAQINSQAEADRLALMNNDNAEANTLEREKMAEEARQFNAKLELEKKKQSDDARLKEKEIQVKKNSSSTKK